jgi:hypothetical protein
MKHFNPRFFRSIGPGVKRVKPERKMYGEFVTWIEQKTSSEDPRFQESIEDHPESSGRSVRLIGVGLAWLDESLWYTNGCCTV